MQGVAVEGARVVFMVVLTFLENYLDGMTDTRETVLIQMWDIPVVGVWETQGTESGDSLFLVLLLPLLTGSTI
jgi:hypothetical protein